MPASGDGSAPPDFVRDSQALLAAHELAAEAHAGQERKKGDGAPYLEHPLAVAARLEQLGFGEPVLIAAILHDVVEDSELSLGEVVERFGVEVGELVGAMTEDESIDDYAERKRAHRQQMDSAGADAAAIYAADKLVNLRDLRVLYRDVGERAAERFKAPLDVRVDLWREDLELAERRVTAPALVRELREELAGFERDREVATV